MLFAALYRVNYDINNWKLLTKSFQALPEITKVQVLTDSSAMTNAGLLDKIIMWNILEKMEKESGIILWTPALRLLTTIQNRLWDSNLFKVIKVIQVIKVILEAIRLYIILCNKVYCFNYEHRSFLRYKV